MFKTQIPNKNFDSICQSSRKEMNFFNCTFIIHFRKENISTYMFMVQFPPYLFQDYKKLLQNSTCLRNNELSQCLTFYMFTIKDYRKTVQKIKWQTNLRYRANEPTFLFYNMNKNKKQEERVELTFSSLCRRVSCKQNFKNLSSNLFHYKFHL